MLGILIWQPARSNPHAVVVVVEQEYYFDRSGWEPRYYQLVAINRTVEAITRRQFSPEFFDLIVVDECHRGSAAEDPAWPGGRRGQDNASRRF